MSPTAVVYGIGYSCEEALPFFQYHVYGNGREKDGFSQRAGGLCSDGLRVAERDERGTPGGTRAAPRRLIAAEQFCGHFSMAALSRRSALLLSSLWYCCKAAALSTSTSAANQKLAAHLAQLKAQREKQQQQQGSTSAQPPIPGESAAVPAQLSEPELCERLGIPAMRPFQQRVLRHMGVLRSCGDDGRVPLGARRDVLSVQPTGAGKSVCFQAAGAALEGTTLVVSPLLSLMFDQVASLELSGIRTATLNSMQTQAEREAVMKSLANRELDLLYTSPEQLDKNANLIRTLGSIHVPLLAVDEAHCISSWGHDLCAASHLDPTQYPAKSPLRIHLRADAPLARLAPSIGSRPSYRRISQLREHLDVPRLLALTASAPPVVRNDIAKQLNMGSHHLRLIASCRRENIRLSRGDKTISQLLGVLAPQRAASGEVFAAGPALVYAQTRKEVCSAALLSLASGFGASSLC